MQQRTIEPAEELLICLRKAIYRALNIEPTRANILLKNSDGLAAHSFFIVQLREPLNQLRGGHFGCEKKKIKKKVNPAVMSSLNHTTHTDTNPLNPHFMNPESSF
jgi:hypothetical protein